MGMEELPSVKDHNKRKKRHSNDAAGSRCVPPATSAMTTTMPITTTVMDVDLLWIDPAFIRFQHSRIRSHFSGCGCSLVETLQSIRDRTLSPHELPPIQVLIGNYSPNEKKKSNRSEYSDSTDPVYFSLNNRRLWILKCCRDEGLLTDTNNRIGVRVRSWKSATERARYTVENCSLHAKIVADRPPTQPTAIKKNRNPVRTKDGKILSSASKSKRHALSRGDFGSDDDNTADRMNVTNSGFKTNVQNRSMREQLSGNFSSEESEDDDDDDNNSSIKTYAATASSNPFAALFP